MYTPATPPEQPKFGIGRPEVQPHWPSVAAALSIGVIYFAMPDPLIVGPRWLLLAITSLREPVPQAGDGWSQMQRWTRIPLFPWLGRLGIEMIG